MLALVKKPHIEISIHGEHVDELLAWIQKKYDLAVLADEPENELLPILIATPPSKAHSRVSARCAWETTGSFTSSWTKRY